MKRLIPTVRLAIAHLTPRKGVWLRLCSQVMKVAASFGVTTALWKFDPSSGLADQSSSPTFAISCGWPLPAKRVREVCKTFAVIWTDCANPRAQAPQIKSDAPAGQPSIVEPGVAVPVAPPPIEVPIVELVVVDEPDLETSDVLAESDDEWNPDSPPAKLEDYYGLSERFFTHQTIEQNQIIARSPIGPMFVEGVAGSGKTSAALGRTKMLTTFNAANVVDEKIFRDILGQGQDYWSAEYAGQF